MTYRISVDTGGTFTDVVVAGEDGNLILGKALTDRERAFESIRGCLAGVVEDLNTNLTNLLKETSIIIYGTTRSTNAIIEEKTAKTAFFTTDGFPDILVLKEGGKFDPHRLDMEYPEPYVPRSLTYEIPGRVNAEGGIVSDLDEIRIRELLEECKANEIEAIGVSLIWSIINPTHELRVGELIEEVIPDVPFTLSHQLNPMMREYRRASSTVIDASLKPLTQKYLTGLEEDLRGAGYENDILVSTSFGGVMHLVDVVERPIYLVKSGPAMAPVAGQNHAVSEELPRDVIVCDSGGTTFDVSLVRDYEIDFTRETWLGPRWTGHNLGMASVAVHSIGAGGGSIAWVDSGGLLRVGPQSSGAEPGPACYNQGGTKPTVTDAAVILGFLNPNHFLGGRMRLIKKEAEKAVRNIADTLSLTLERAAFAVIAVANQNMIQAIREITINEGVDPRSAALIAGGGAGGLNIVPIARELGCTKIFMPRTAGALSAAGMQVSNIVTEAGASCFTASNDFDFKGVKTALDAIRLRLNGFSERLHERGISEIEIKLYVEARYRFQVWELEIGVPGDVLETQKHVDELVEQFHKMHERVFAVRDSEQPVEFLNWRGRLTGFVKGETSHVAKKRVSTEVKAREIREVFFGDEEGLLKTMIYRGGDLQPGDTLSGPAILEESTSTLVVEPGTTVSVTSHGDYLLEVGG